MGEELELESPAERAPEILGDSGRVSASVGWCLAGITVARGASLTTAIGDVAVYVGEHLDRLERLRWANRQGAVGGEIKIIS